MLENNQLWMIKRGGGVGWINSLAQISEFETIFSDLDPTCQVITDSDPNFRVVPDPIRSRRPVLKLSEILKIFLL